MAGRSSRYHVERIERSQQGLLDEHLLVRREITRMSLIHLPQEAEPVGDALARRGDWREVVRQVPFNQAPAADQLAERSLRPLHIHKHHVDLAHCRFDAFGDMLPRWCPRVRGRDIKKHAFPRPPPERVPHDVPVVNWRDVGFQCVWPSLAPWQYPRRIENPGSRLLCISASTLDYHGCPICRLCECDILRAPGPGAVIPRPHSA